MNGRADIRSLIDESGREFTRAMIIANTVGAVIVALFLTLVLPVRHPPPLGRILILNSGALVYLVAVCWLMPRWGRALSERRLDWLLEGREPTPCEQRRALRQGLAQASRLVVVWALAAALFGTINLAFSAEIAGAVATGILLGGLVTCSISYLAGERVLRPITARVLEHGVPMRPSAPGILMRTLLAWLVPSGVALFSIADIAEGMLTGRAPRSDVTAWSIIFLAVVGVVAGGIAIVYAAKSVAEPVRSVRRALAEVEEGRTDVAVAVDDASEVGLLQAGFNRMAAGLRERERLRDLFGRHVGEEVARQAVEGDVSLGGELCEASVLFVDVVGSTALASDCPPHEVVARLNAFFGLVLAAVSAHGGWLNKFEGDAALCVFGVPRPLEDHAGAALAAARELCRTLERESPLDAAIGVSSGEVVAGNIGAAERLEYTVIGDAVNEASRLCELAKSRHPRLLASGRSLAGAHDGEVAHWRLGEEVVLRGRAAPTALATLAPASVPLPTAN